MMKVIPALAPRIAAYEVVERDREDRLSIAGRKSAAYEIPKRDASKPIPAASGTSRNGELPYNFFRYILATSWHHQLLLSVLTVTVFLLDVAPLELQRRVINDLVKHRAYRLVIMLGIVYAAAVIVQGGIKLAVNVYRGWVGERAKRDLRRRIHSVIDVQPGSPAAEAQGSRLR